ncbi:carbonic anhydrase 15-like isoform X2 [Dromiciops gliroides]|uniref:carbonic anhydrase 15-like isoform X2 n=1 Tax=Dromiciops gliroides TaxID=33562 RepID=UPI001CC4D09F|nr:carbonic anhydrase 15-like isoform X2 [Dromiciops gliroides]
MQPPGVPFAWLTLPLLVQAAPDGSWCYDSQNPQCGPSHWKEIAHTCGGSAQSPIDIDRRQVKMDPSLGPFVFEGYDSAPPGPWQLLNDGHTVLLKLQGAQSQGQGQLCIRAGGLPHTYCALQLHFHWGSPTGNGSEHTLDGQRQPMEMHVVHMNTLYQNLQEARGHPGGLAVLAFLFKVQNEANANYNTIVSGLRNISYQGEFVELASTFRLDKLLPEPALLSRYYRYPGSLTTPACDEVVSWTVFEEPIPIGRAQLAQFVSTLQASPPDAHTVSVMVNNFRPAQPLGARRVLASRDATVSGAAAFSLPTETWVLLCLLLSLGCGPGFGGAL